MRPDYASSEDDDLSVAPPPSESAPATPTDRYDMPDIEMDDDAELPPITGIRPDRKLELPPVKDLFAEVCAECDAERLRRHEWNRQHEREHPRHIYSGGDGMILQAVRPLTPVRRSRHSISAYPVAHPHPYMQPHSAAQHALYRPRYATQAHVPSYTPDTRTGPLTQYARPAPPAHHYPAPDFSTFTFGAPASAGPELPVAPTDTYAARRNSLAFDARPRRGSAGHHPHGSSVASSRSSTAARRLSIASVHPDDESPAPPDMPFAESSHAPRHKPASKPKPPTVPSEPFASSSSSLPPTPPPVAAVAAAPAGPRSAHPFTAPELLELGDKFLLALAPRRTSVQCAWNGGCGVEIYEPLTANIVQHLADAHGVRVPAAADGETTTCLWHDAPAPEPEGGTGRRRSTTSAAGGLCGRTLKVVSMRNHILNCHEKAKTGTCRLCGGFISRAETYLMHRHLTSCVSRVARATDIDDALLAKGVRVVRDAQGAARFEFVDGRPATTVLTGTGAGTGAPGVSAAMERPYRRRPMSVSAPAPPAMVFTPSSSSKPPDVIMQQPQPPPQPQRTFYEDDYEDLDEEFEARHARAHMIEDGPPASSMDVLAHAAAARLPTQPTPNANARYQAASIS